MGFLHDQIIFKDSFYLFLFANLAHLKINTFHLIFHPPPPTPHPPKKKIIKESFNINYPSFEFGYIVITCKSLLYRVYKDAKYTSNIFQIDYTIIVYTVKIFYQQITYYGYMYGIYQMYTL